MTAVRNLSRFFALLTILRATAVRLGDNADDAAAPVHKAEAKQHDAEDGHKKVKDHDQDAKAAHKTAVYHDAQAAHKKANLTRGKRCYIFTRMMVFKSCIEEKSTSYFFTSSSDLDKSHDKFEKGGWDVSEIYKKDCEDMGFACKEPALKEKRKKELEDMDSKSGKKDKGDPVDGLEMYKKGKIYECDTTTTTTTTKGGGGGWFGWGSKETTTTTTTTTKGGSWWR